MQKLLFSVAVAGFLLFLAGRVMAGDADDFCESARKGDFGLVKSMISKNPMLVKARTSSGSTALMQAALYGRREIVLFLVGHGADVNAKDRYGHTALMWASAGGYREIASFLISKGADVNARNVDSSIKLVWTPVAAGKEKMALLVMNTGKTGGSAGKGKTALAFAREAGHNDLVELLRKHGAR